MTKREAFSTGKPHQSAVATWARARLVDRGGCEFDDGTNQTTPTQIGCLFADGVGLGKTWEALAAVALLLDKRALRTRRRRANPAKGARRKKRFRRRRRVARVLILLPPGLVAKWSRELGTSDQDGFPKRLAKWAKRGSRAFIASTLGPGNCFDIRRRSDLASLPRGRIKRGKYTLPAGTYLCNWNVFLGSGGRGRDRVTALKNQRWDVVVVDEAHHKAARKALDKFEHPAHTLLLTATPFQLDMTELHGLTKHLVEGKAPAHKVLKRGVVRDYAKAADRAFEGGAPPSSLERSDAEEVLGQLIACSQVGRQQRHYFAIDGDGTPNPVDPPTELEQEDLSKIFKQGIQAPNMFMEWYLQQRLKLARREADDTPKHVAVELQKLLSVKKPPAPPAPRLDALRAWARAQFVEDLDLTLGDGLPRKLLVFTHLKTNVTGPIKQVLEEELKAAHREVSRSRRWRDARKAAPQGLASVLADVKQHISSDKLQNRLDKFGHAIRCSLFLDLFGSKKFARKAKQELLKIVGVDQLIARSRAINDEATVGWYAA